MHEEFVFKVISTDDFLEFQDWITYMRTNQIDYKARMQNIAGTWKCSLEIIGKDNNSIEKIKKDIGFYYDDWGAFTAPLIFMV